MAPGQERPLFSTSSDTVQISGHVFLHPISAWGRAKLPYGTFGVSLCDCDPMKGCSVLSRRSADILVYGGPPPTTCVHDLVHMLVTPLDTESMTALKSYSTPARNKVCPRRPGDLSHEAYCRQIFPFSIVLFMGCSLFVGADEYSQPPTTSNLCGGQRCAPGWDGAQVPACGSCKRKRLGHAVHAQL